MRTVIKNGTVVSDGEVRRADVAFADGIITAVEENIAPEAGDEMIDATGKYVFPGLIDSHVHYGLPGTADDFLNGSKLAAFGGVTTVVDYASPLEGKTETESLEARKAEAEEGFVDFTFHAEILGWSPWDAQTMKEIRAFGLNSIKVYTTYAADMLTYDQIRDVMEAAAKEGIFVEVHAEDDKICADKKEEFTAAGTTSPSMHGKARPGEAEAIAVEKLIAVAKETGLRLHIVHVSTGAGAEAIAKAKAEGVRVTAETCPHYLALTMDKYDSDDACLYIMTPPLRTTADNDILWKRLADGTLSSIVTDHCSFFIETKREGDTCFSVKPGIAGTETMLPIINNEGVGKGRLTLARMVEAMTADPAKLFGIYPKKGTLSVGSDADIVLFDAEKEVTLGPDVLHSACGYSVYDGTTVKGWPVLTIRRGETLCKDGEWIAETPSGRFLPTDKFDA